MKLGALSSVVSRAWMRASLVGALWTLVLTVSLTANAQQGQAISGDRQTLAIGETSAPFVAEFRNVVLAPPSNTPAVGVTIFWSTFVIEGSATVQFGSAQTVTDGSGRTSNTITVTSASPGTSGQVTIEVFANTTPGFGSLVFFASIGPGGTISTLQDPCLLQQRVTALSGTALASLDAQRRNLHERLRQLRLDGKAALANNASFKIGGKPLPMLSLASAFSGQEIGSGLDDRQRWGAFVSGDIEIAELKSGDGRNGFDLRTHGMTIGGDYSLEGNHVLGAGLGVLLANSDLNHSGESQRARGISLSLFGSYVPFENAYVDLIATYGRNRYKLRRGSGTVPIAGSGRDGFVCRGLEQAGQASVPQASADPVGEQYLLSLGGGYDLNRGALSFGPYFRIDYLRAKVDGYNEAGTPDFTLRVSEQTARQQRFALGMQASYTMGMPWGVLIPNARVEFERQFGKRGGPVGANRIANALVTLSANPLSEDRSYANVAVGVQGVFPQGLSAYATYERQVAKEDFRRDRLTIGVGIPF